MDKQVLKIRRRIMRRVYTVFAARIASHKLTLNLALFAVALTVFREVVFVKRVLETMSDMPLSGLPQFALNTLMRGEVVTLVAMGVMIFTALSIPWQIRSLRLPVQAKIMA